MAVDDDHAEDNGGGCDEDGNGHGDGENDGDSWHNTFRMIMRMILTHVACQMNSVWQTTGVIKHVNSMDDGCANDGV